MPAVPQSILSHVIEVILSHIRQTSQELQVAPNLGKIASHILWLSIVDPWTQKDSYSFLQRQQTISRVCSSWWALVEDSPRFWSIIEFPCPPAVISHSLEKSQSSGLEIKSFKDSKYGYDPIIEHARWKCFISIAPHADRIRSLVLSSRSLDGVGRVLEKPAPALEELKLDSRGCYDVRAFDLFCGQASRLRDVALRNIAVKWDSGVFTGLRTLIIVDRGEYLPTEEQVRRLLEANPGLEELSIEGLTMTERFENDAVQSTGEGKPSRVVMSKMLELSLSILPYKLAQAVLSNVEIPSMTYFEFMSRLEELPASTMLDPTVNHLVSTVLRLSKAVQQAELTFGQTRVVLAIYTPRHEGPTVRLELIKPTPVSAFEWLTENLFHSEGLPSVCAADTLQVSLKFGEDFNMGDGAFILILDRLNAVKVNALTMERSCHYGEELIKYLGEAQGDSQWPLPYLTSMTLGGPATLADHLSIALQRRMQYSPAGETPAAPRPAMLEVLDISGLHGVDEDVEKALAKCVASSGTFIPTRQGHRFIRFVDLEAEISSDDDI
ncbi:hypothetical protein FS837_011381 [Tulasnella sp. UAMH 9824]|nr:hypothetical protein FS837_011381 [Tulasnella sp. UAMH 9824]